MLFDRIALSRQQVTWLKTFQQLKLLGVDIPTHIDALRHICAMPKTYIHGKENSGHFVKDLADVWLIMWAERQHFA